MRCFVRGTQVEGTFGRFAEEKGARVFGAQGSPPSRKAKEIQMKNSLEVRRQQLLRELARVNRQIAQTQKSLAAVEKQLSALQQAQAKAA
jgi:hypothetical protein